MRTDDQFGITELLEHAGAIPPRYGRGKWNCPCCGGKGCLSVDASKQVFNCFHPGCDFHGGIGTLRKRLAIERKWLPKAEYVRRMQERELTEIAAQRLYAATHARQLELREELRELCRAELVAHEAGPDDPRAWDLLEIVYATKSKVEEELDALESGAAAVFARIAHNTEVNRIVHQH